MNVNWVFENIRENDSFYDKLNTLLLLASPFLWKRHHPSHTTVLTTDQLTYNLLEKVNALTIWDQVDILPKNKHIDKNVFWASSKLEKLRYVKGPTILMDHDFLVYQNLDAYLKDKPFFAHEENGENYYDTSWNSYIREISNIINRPSPHAINCCFAYYPDSNFVNNYAKISLDVMEKFTILKVPNSRFLIFAEQLVLKHLLDYHNIEYNTLLNEKWHAKNKVFIPSDKGHMSFLESNIVYKHYWMDKKLIQKNAEGHSLELECTNLTNLLSKTDIDLGYINNAL